MASHLIAPPCLLVATAESARLLGAQIGSSDGNSQRSLPKPLDHPELLVLARQRIIDRPDAAVAVRIADR